MSDPLLVVTEPGWFDPVITVGSVVLGALLAYGSTFLFELRKRRESRLATAYSLMFKIQEMVDDLIKIEQHIQNSTHYDVATQSPYPLWQTYIDLLGTAPLAEKITSSELALVAMTKDQDLTIRVRELESGHFLAVKSIERLSDLKNELARSGLLKHADGQTVTIEVTTKAEHAAIAPTIAKLNDLSQEIVSMLPRVVANAKEVTNKLGQHLKNHYKFNHFVSLTIKQ